MQPSNINQSNLVAPTGFARDYAGVIVAEGLIRAA
jgi:hypothetical protein